ncbi:MAG: hypothetical protein N2049_09220 [Anaerolineales bacterium]|nr:hypothetical protein [Anaerolineales bacterium]MCX7609380.1 hypothetical protein [Anaerolineales bacterium]
MDTRFLQNVVIKGLTLFLVMNFLVMAVPSEIGRLSLYNVLWDGRVRLPFGEDSQRAYNLSLFNLDAMFASHVIHAAPKEDEYRVLVFGDSSVWGTLLHPEETLTGLLNAADLRLCDGRPVVFYNLGYPTISLTKDLMLLDYALRYQPDLIVWLLTLEAFPLENQLASPLVAHNAERVETLIARYQLPFAIDDPAFVRPKWWERTLIGQRRPLADLIRLQLYGILWSATGIDQTYPSNYPPAQRDFDEDVTFHGQDGPPLDVSKLAFDVLRAGIAAAGDTPVVLINEPMLISTGKNSNLRYNFFYPRWAYDEWRFQMQEMATTEGWNYLDLWNLVPETEFTNSAIHLTPAGERMLADAVRDYFLQSYRCP